MSGFFAVRGSRDLSEKEFLAHIALCIRLENVGMLLGAGASKGAGGKTMAELWTDFVNNDAECASWLTRENFCSGQVVNVESLLDSVELAILEWTRQREGEKLQKLKDSRDKLIRSLIRAVVLTEKVWERPEALFESDVFSSHIKLLSRLVSNRQPGQAAPWVFTTNYDLSVEWAAELLFLHVINGFSGDYRVDIPKHIS